MHYTTVLFFWGFQGISRFWMRSFGEPRETFIGLKLQGMFGPTSNSKNFFLCVCEHLLHKLVRNKSLHSFWFLRRPKHTHSSTFSNSRKLYVPHQKIGGYLVSTKGRNLVIIDTMEKMTLNIDWFKKK